MITASLEKQIIKSLLDTNDFCLSNMKYMHFLFLETVTYHMWVFCYFGNKLCPCYVISAREKDEVVRNLNLQIFYVHL